MTFTRSNKSGEMKHLSPAIRTTTHKEPLSLWYTVGVDTVLADHGLHTVRLDQDRKRLLAGERMALSKFYFKKLTH